MKNVVIKDIARVVGDVVVSNDELVEKYKTTHSMPEEKSRHILDSKLGRNKRHVVGGVEDNSLLLGVRAVDKLLSKSDVNKDDIDMIVFASQFPEYTCPTQAVLLHNHCGFKKDCLSFDLNANCSAGLYGISVARLMLLGGYKNAIVVASDLMSKYCQDGCLITEGCFGDAGVAVLLQVTEDAVFRGFSISESYMTAESVNMVFYPECGNSNQDMYTGESTKLSWYKADFSEATEKMGEGLKNVLSRYNYTLDDLNWVCCSQFTRNTGIDMATKSGIDTSKLVYVGDKYGYTGVSSPLMAYCDALEDGRIKDGDLIGFTTIGLGGQAISMLYVQ